MTKWICKESFSTIQKGEIYYIEIFLPKEEIFSDYIGIYDENKKLIGEWWNCLDYFMPLAEWREQQINQIFDETNL